MSSTFDVILCMPWYILSNKWYYLIALDVEIVYSFAYLVYMVLACLDLKSLANDSLNLIYPHAESAMRNADWNFQQIFTHHIWPNADWQWSSNNIGHFAPQKTRFLVFEYYRNAKKSTTFNAIFYNTWTLGKQCLQNTQETVAHWMEQIRCQTKWPV